MAQGNPKALIPILVFVVLHLGLGITLEYGLHVEMGFYSIPVLLIFLIALAIAFLQTKNVDYDGKFSIMANPIAKDISREYGLPVRQSSRPSVSPFS